MSETLATMFWSRVDKSADRPAQISKRHGGWTTLTWREVGEVVRKLAIFSAGCITVPVYPTYPPDLIAYVINDSGARTIIVEDPGQLAKVLEAREKTPGLQQIIVMTGYEATQPPKMVMTWDMLRRLGRDNSNQHTAVLAERLAATTPDDLASIVYTSGTTGPPKGVMQTHGNHLAAQRNSESAAPCEEGWVHLLFLPLAHSFARLESFLGVYRGLCTAFAENLDKVGDNLKEVRPHFICSVPRVFEKVYAKILSGVEAGSPAKKKIFHWAIGVGREVSRHEQRGQPLSASLRVKRAIAHKLVFSKLHAALGGRLRWAISGGAPLSREIAEFFHSAGILILEGYGLTETCPTATFNRPTRFKFGSVGQALDNVEIKIAADGEILIRGANVARGYLKQPEATAEVFEPSGWFHSGDIGRLDGDGFLFITDRKKDLIVTAGGMNIAPQNIENMLKADPFISQAMVYGDRKPYPVALITVNVEELAKFAREQGILATDPAVVVKHPKVLERVGRTVEEKNSQLQSYAKIKKFTVLPVDFSQEGGELTPTLKVKRKIVSNKYLTTIEELYR
jgi:long-chain acyl-CoA synthetase